MNLNHKIVAIIPARGGSKGIPGKNLKLLNGKPLICYTIEEALKSKYLHQVLVSTDDELIAETSKKSGADVIKRPYELATDSSPVIDAVFHTINTIKKDCTPYIIVLLQPTSPFRNVSDINAAIELFLNNDCDSVISMCKVEHSPYQYFRFEDDSNRLIPLLGDKYLTIRRQDLPDIYRPNGAIYITTFDTLHRNNSFYGGKIIPYIMPSERSIDIDEEIDLELAEILIEKVINKS